MFEPKIDVRAYDHDRFYRHDERFKALTMPAVEILEFPRHDGVFFSSTCLHSQIPYDVG